MIKTVDIALGQIGVAQLNPLGIAVPDVAPGVYATGYYIDDVTGQQYYYDAPNDQWYYSAAGIIYPLAISWKPSPSPKINLGAGDTLRFLLSFKSIFFHLFCFRLCCFLYIRGYLLYFFLDFRGGYLFISHNFLHAFSLLNCLNTFHSLMLYIQY